MRRVWTGLLLGLALLAPGCRWRRAEAPGAPLRGVFTRVGPMVEGRMDPRAVALASGQVLITSGTYLEGSPETDASGSTELYDPGTEAFYELPPMRVPRISHALAPLPDGDALVVGGWARGKLLVTLERYRGREGDFQELTGVLQVPRSDPQLVTLPGGRVLVLGGRGKEGRPVALIELVDPPSGRVWGAGNLQVPRMGGFRANLLPDGQVLVTGGETAEHVGTALTELFDPTKGTSTALPPMSAARTRHLAVALPDGRVLLAGGEARTRTGEVVVEASAEVYDPPRRAFTRVGPLTMPRTRAAGALVGKGQVLIVGGWNTLGDLATSERFDPLKGTFGPDAPLYLSRGDDVALSLPGGRVLVLGSGLEIAERYE
jgi:hypothetical protein